MGRQASQAAAVRPEQVPCASIPGLAWHVVYTLPAHESACALQLGRDQAGVWYPRVVDRDSKGAAKWSAMFPRYVFCQMAGERLRWGCVVRSSAGVELGTVLRSAAGNPLVVPERVVTELRAGCDETGAWHVPQARRAAVGDSVTVQSGAYAGWQGVVSASKAERVAVLLSILGGQAPVWIDRAAVQISG